MHKFKFYFWLFLILIFAFISRFNNLARPSTYVFDEQYHVSAAKLSLSNDSRFYEWWHPVTEEGVYFDWLHPPLMKYVQAIAMAIGGQNALAWRMPSLFFGMGLLIVTYFLAKELLKDDKLALIATALVSVDGLVLVQSRIGMNDIVISFFIVLLFYVYLLFKRKADPSKLFWVGAIAGLSIATKWTGFFVLFFIFLDLIYQLYLSKQWHKLPWTVFCLIIVPAGIYLLSFSQMFLQGKNLDHFLQLHKQIIWYQTHRLADHAQASHPGQWFTNTGPIVYWRDHQADSKFLPTIIAFGNPFLQLLIAFSVMAQLFTMIRLFLAKKSIKHNCILLLAVYFVVWLPWILSPRIMFYYHYTPAVALACIIVAMQLKRWQKSFKTDLSILALILSFFVFLIFYPMWIGIDSSQDDLNTVYLFLFN